MAAMERANAGLHPHIIAKVLELQRTRDARIVDVGCGSGAMLLKLADLGYTALHGIDIVRPHVACAGIEFSECDLDRLETGFEDASVDLVVSVEVFEHIENLGSLLRELSRVLRPNGRMLITTPNVHSVEARLRYLLLGQLKQFDRIGDPTHITPLFIHPFTLLLRRHGLEINECWGWPLDGTSPTSRPGLRAAGRLLRALGLRAAPSGDQLCLVIRKVADAERIHASQDKQLAVTAHYA
jgi:2-polyprenyl-3-methyl-5-hydroxy-6-metoxy-1,4-benzoquinol methylase